MRYVENNAIAGFPTPWALLSIYLFFKHTPIILYNKFKMYKLPFIMLGINSQHNNVNTTLRLQHYDNRHRHE